MKKTWKYLLMAALVCSLSFAVTSCSDDDDDNKKSEEQKEQEAQEAQQKADAFWAVVGQLTSIDNYTADYEGKTFEPTIGEPLEGNYTVRVVATNDMVSAAERFANLTGASIDANTNSYTWKDDAIGTMTYTKTNNGQSWATVDVSIKQLPSLQQIVYRSPEQAGTNASERGVCYYRFGDVVKKTYADKDDNNKQKTEYWVCVRPAFNPEGKGDSHWITVSPLPKKNVWQYTDSKKRQHALPTGIGTNKEHTQNLAEMLYAIFQPAEWEKNVINYPAPGLFSDGLRMFHDFDHGKVKYHSAKFWQRVRDAWEREDVCLKLFGTTTNGLETSINNYGLNILVKGYSWWTKTSWNLSLYQYTYKNGQQFKSNMHDMTGETEVKKNVENIAAINVLEQYTLEKPFISNRDFFGDDGPRYIIRHATGKELAGFSPNVYVTLASNNNGITDVYTYNQFYKQNVNNNELPETFDVEGKMEKPKVGQYVGKDGKFYNSTQDAQLAGTTAVAIVAYYNEKKTVDACGYHGLAISLESLGSYEMKTGYDDCMIGANSADDAIKDLCGIGATKKMSMKLCGLDHQHPGMALIAEKEAIKNNNFSNWFIPSAGQWILALEGLGVKYNGMKDNKGTFSGNYTTLSNYLPDGTLDGTYMSTTSHNDQNWVFALKKQGSFSMMLYNHTYEVKYIPFVAFDKTGNTDKGFYEKALTKKGTIIGQNGKFYETINDALNSDVTPAAVVVYTDEEGGIETNEKNYTRLALSFTSFERQWATEYRACSGESVEKNNLGKKFNGIATTKAIWQNCKICNGSHPAAKACHDMTELNQAVFSPWFIPSSGQLMLLLKGTSDDFKSINDMGGFVSFTNFFGKLNIEGGALSPGTYWTATEANANYAWTFIVDRNKGFSFDYSYKNKEYVTRPMIAF